MPTYFKILGIILLLLASFNVSGQIYNVGDEMFIIAHGGLQMRDKPHIESDKLVVLEKATKVLILDNPNPEIITLANGYTGHWVKIQSKDIIGYVFDAYLSKLPPMDFVQTQNNGCWTNDILGDYAVKIGKVDSIEYYNYGDGERYYKMRIYKLNNGHKYIEHDNWEVQSNEIQLFNLTDEEMDQLVKSILRNCEEENGIPNMVGLKKQNHIHYDQFNSCCVYHLNFIREDKTLIIDIQMVDQS